jgi:presenilin-like A22 family membrane protease
MERPQMSGVGAIVYIILGVLIGTAFLLILIRFKKVKVWTVWYFLAVLMCLSLAFGAFLADLPAFILALAITALKIFRPNVFVHNISEVFVYGGLAALFVPILNIAAAIVLLLIISGYDMIAVWKSKHMIKLAKFQAGTRLFAGLTVAYNKKKNTIESKIPASNLSGKAGGGARTAIIGGGDVAFPIIFSGVVLQKLVHSGIGFAPAFFQAAIIGVFATIALALLLFNSKPGKFYPAMPFITAGCVAGYGVVLLIGLL